MIQYYDLVPAFSYEQTVPPTILVLFKSNVPGSLHYTRRNSQELHTLSVFCCLLTSSSPLSSLIPKAQRDKHTMYNLSALPKTELHLHLDGSLTPDYILKRADSRKIVLPMSVRSATLRAYLMEMKSAQIGAGNKQAFNSNWSVFDFCNQFLQTKEELRDATHDLFTSLKQQHNVSLCEIRFCPILHTLEGLSSSDAVEAVLEGLKSAKETLSSTLFEGGIIICALRSHTPEEAVSLAELCAGYLELGVVGFDVAGDEGSYPLIKLEAALSRAKELGVPVTVHAGEWPVNDKFGDSSLTNLKFAVSHGVDRVGHGCQLYRDPKLMDQVARMKVRRYHKRSK